MPKIIQANKSIKELMSQSEDIFIDGKKVTKKFTVQRDVLPAKFGDLAQIQQARPKSSNDAIVHTEIVNDEMKQLVTRLEAIR